MKKFKYYFTKKNGALALCSVHISSGKRCYTFSCFKEFGVDPDEFEWDEINHQFAMPAALDVNTLRANMKLADIIEHYKKEEVHIPKKETNPFTYGKKKKKPCERKNAVIPTLGDFLRQIVKDMRSGKQRTPSKSWQNYSNLLSKLCKEGNLVNMVLTDIDNDCAEEFARWIAEELSGKNFIELMKMLRATMTKAYETGYCSRKLTYDFSGSVYAPNRLKSAFVDVLSVEQWQSFNSFNPTNLTFKNANYERNKELYHDFCILMYETNIRPCDLCQASRDKIKSFLGKKYYCYVPQKKKYMKVMKEVAVPLTEKALSIIDKYSGEMLLPLGFNEKYRNLADNDTYRKFDSGRNNFLRNVNGWLHELESVLGFRITSLYMIRHTSITHKCNTDGANLMQIAKQAGTSLKMIENTYYSSII